MENKKYYYDIKKNQQTNKYYINKYLVSLDIEKLKILKENIINNCSHITHKKYKTTDEPNYFDTSHIRNYQSKKLGIVEQNDFLTPNKREYLVEYDYYEHSKLVKTIDTLLKGNLDIIDVLMKKDFLKEPTLETIKIDKELLNKEISILMEKGLYEEIDLLVKEKKEEQLIKAQEIFGLETVYLAQIKKCIIMNLYDQLELEEFTRIKEFFTESDISKNISKNLTKVLKPIS